MVLLQLSKQLITSRTWEGTPSVSYPCWFFITGDPLWWLGFCISGVQHPGFNLWDGRWLKWDLVDTRRRQSCNPFFSILPSGDGWCMLMPPIYPDFGDDHPSSPEGHPGWPRNECLHVFRPTHFPFPSLERPSARDRKKRVATDGSIFNGSPDHSLSQRIAWHETSQPGQAVLFISVVVNSGVGSRPTVLFRSLSQSWKGIASWKSVNRSWCLCMCFIESHEFYWNRVLGFESAYLVESPNVVYKLYAYRAALWLGWDGEHSGKQVSGNEQCCELFGDLPCPLSGRSLLGVVDP